MIKGKVFCIYDSNSEKLITSLICEQTLEDAIQETYFLIETFIALISCHLKEETIEIIKKNITISYFNPKTLMYDVYLEGYENPEGLKKITNIPIRSLNPPLVNNIKEAFDISFLNLNYLIKKDVKFRGGYFNDGFVYGPFTINKEEKIDETNSNK